MPNSRPLPFLALGLLLVGLLILRVGLDPYAHRVSPTPWHPPTVVPFTPTPTPTHGWWGPTATPTPTLTFTPTPTP